MVRPAAGRRSGFTRGCRVAIRFSVQARSMPRRGRCADVGYGAISASDAGPGAAPVVASLVAAGAGCEPVSVDEAAAGWSAEASAVSVSASSVGAALAVFQTILT